MNLRFSCARGVWRAAAWLSLATCGCSVLRELPREQYAARPERGDAQVVTRAGARHEFHRVRVSADSLVGYQRSRSEGPYERYQAVPLSLDEVARFSVRGVDWYRTGLILGVGVAVALAVVLTQSPLGGSAPDPGPCPRCP